MHTDPDEAVLAVVDLASLIDFLGVLGADWEACSERNARAPGSPYASMEGWENGSIGSFLEAMQRWSVDARIRQDEYLNPYQLFAYQLLAGKSYE